MVYAAVVIVVNLKIMHETNTHSWVSITLNILSILSFWAWFWLESLFSFFPEVYDIFNEFIVR